MARIKREKRTTEEGNYVRNADLLPVVLEAKRLGKVTDELILKIQMIAVRLSLKYNFVGYSFRDDMVASAICNLCNVKNALKFDPERSSNPFSFYTTAIYNSFLQYLLEEKNHRNIRDALLIDAGSSPSFNFLQGEKDESHFEFSDSDNIGVDMGELLYGTNIESSENTSERKEEPEVSVESSHHKAIPRTHGKIMSYKPDDYFIDPETNEMTLKPDAIGSEFIPPIKEVVAPSKKRNPFAKKKVVTEPEISTIDSVSVDFEPSDIDQTGIDE